MKYFSPKKAKTAVIYYFEHVKGSTLAIWVFALIGVCFVLYGVGTYTQSKLPIPQTEEHITTHDAKRNTPTAQQKDKSDWKLILINRAHPLSAQYKVDVTDLHNGQSIDARVYPALTQMIADARAQGLRPVICSSYRSTEKQRSLYDNKVKSYKKDGFADEEAFAQAAAWVAPPGTSEHQAGLSADIVDINNQTLDESQETTPVSLWLKAHCHEYGFILRYPTEKNQITGVNYEPWHYRYVGQEAAAAIMSQELTLEEYLEETATP